MTDQTQTIRLDMALVARGLVETRAQAQAAIKAGGVMVDGVQVGKASLKVGPAQVLSAEKAHPYVSRGGLKLAHAIQAFNLHVSGRICIDIGASTGGFTQVLLEAGAARVFAVDVGRGQLHPGLLEDQRVTSLEATDARALTQEIISPAPGLLVCDASFIMLERVLEIPLSLLAAEAEAVVLFKPQFQVGPENVGRGGIVTDQSAVTRSLGATKDWLKSKGWRIAAQEDSPITGGDGNREILLHVLRNA